MAILQNRTYNPPKFEPMALKSQCQKLTYTTPMTLQSCTYDPEIPISQSSPTILQVPPTTLRSSTYDSEIPMSKAHLQVSKSYLRPSKVAPTTLKSPCQKLTYSPTYDPSKLHLRPSNLHVRSSRRPFSHFGCLQS